jgi:hypothetical protein
MAPTRTIELRSRTISVGDSSVGSATKTDQKPKKLAVRKKERSPIMKERSSSIKKGRTHSMKKERSAPIKIKKERSPSIRLSDIPEYREPVTREPGTIGTFRVIKMTKILLGRPGLRLVKKSTQFVRID